MKKLSFPTSLPDFVRLFPDEDACSVYLHDVRWPDGFFCPKCRSTREPYEFANRPAIRRCRDCKTDQSLTAGTVMHSTHTPLNVWFWGAYLVSSLTPGLSAVQFQRQLGISRYETAFQILHKLRAGMVRPDRDRIGTEWPVEADEVLIGGRTRGQGRGVHNKIVVAGAIEAIPGAKPSAPGTRKVKKGGLHAGRLRLRAVEDRARASLEPFILENVEPGAFITTDDWTGYDRLPELGYKHRQVVMGRDPEMAEEYLPMIHLIFSNLKAWLLGVHHGVSSKHLQAYLNEFVFRFNRRFYPFNAFLSLLGIGVQVESPTYDDLYSGDWMHPNPDH